MDISKFDTTKKSNEGVWLDIYSPDYTEVIAQFKVAGRDSKVLKKRQQELAKKRSGKRKFSSLEEETDTIETIAFCTLDWNSMVEGKVEKEGKIIDDGVEYDCDFDNAKMVYFKYNWIAEQVLDYILERSNFL